MGNLFDMEWNTKWDWDNYGALGPKPLESAKKMQQLSDWMIADDGDNDARSFNLSGGVGVSNWNVSSSKSSVSASTETSAKDGTSNFKLRTLDNCLRNNSKKSNSSGNSLPLEASVGSVEPSIALELGKRTFFDNSAKTPSLSAMSTSSSSSCLKKLKSSAQNIPLPRCLVEGCNADLSTAKEYHRKHRVCDTHSKSPKVIIRGVEHRFCQQCSRFHTLSEFDEKKRSCRKRLSEHNARRRKPPPETIRFNPTGLSPSFYGSEGRQQTSFLLNNTLLLQPRSTSSPAFNSKFTITKGSSLKYNGDGGDCNEQFHMSGARVPQRFSDIHGGKANGLMVSKSNMRKLPNPGSKGNLISSQFNAVAASDYGRALSLLSTTNSLPWISSGQQPTADHHQSIINLMQDATTTNHHHQLMQTIPEGVPLHSSPPEFWLSSSRNHRNHSVAPSSVSFQESHLMSTPPYEADFYSNILN